MTKDQKRKLLRLAAARAALVRFGQHHLAREEALAEAAMLKTETNQLVTGSNALVTG